MNKYQEALEKIENETTYIDDYETMPYTTACDFEDEINILRELVEKATPKKPTNGLNYLHCQTCKNHLPNAFVEYCPHCGQKLDWSEDERD